MSSRRIVHVDLDSFYVSVERLLNPRLNGLPVIVGGNSDRGVVSSCSYEARAFGVHAAMPIKKAKQLCTDAVFVVGDMDKYSKYSNLVTDIIAENSPIYEKASIDEHYIDISGMDKFYSSLKWAQDLKGKINKNTGLPISFAVSINKTVAKIGTGEVKPLGEIYIEQEKVNQFLDPLAITKIPMLGKKTFEILSGIGLKTIKDIREMPVETLVKLLGKNGQSIWEKANGIDNSEVIPYQEQKSMSSETTFINDIIDVNNMLDIISEMVVNLAYKLRKEELLTSTVTVKIRYSDFDTQTLQKQIPYSAFDHHLILHAKELFLKLYRRRTKVRLIGVKFSKLVRGAAQLNLFEDATEMTNLYKALDAIKNKYGEQIIKRGNSL
ncbi:MAG TPA: DNA polymerase IV [Bacteroidales bacterium]|nr:DNA polymerase IV [Bacteroidales bacterium]HPL03820.1 DNA polymerase IV [Bacteroidales bacterium]